MPLTHTRVFRIRHYECDAYRHLNAITYLRYMQETAFDASAAAGYGLLRYDAMDRTWFVTETDIEYLAPMSYGQSAAVTTWVEDFRKVRSRRAYEVRDAETGALTAQASTDWAFLEKSTGRPAAITDEMIAAFWPEGRSTARSARERFPAAPPPPAEVFRQRRRVEWRDLDPAQHVNNAVYLAYVEECGVQAEQAYHWPESRMATAGAGIFTRRHRIEYRAQAVLDDELEVATWFYGVRNSSFTRYYEITRVGDGALIAHAHSVYVWVDMATGRPAVLPAGLLADFAPNRSAE